MRIEQIEPNKEDIDQIDRRRNRARIEIEGPLSLSDRDNSPPLPRSVVSPDLSEGAIDVAFETVQEQVREFIFTHILFVLLIFSIKNCFIRLVNGRIVKRTIYFLQFSTHNFMSLAEEAIFSYIILLEK